MDTAHYEQIIYKQLENKNTYKKVDPSCENKTMRANNALIKKYGNSFLKQENNYLNSFQQETSNFYGLPKIHKSKIIFQSERRARFGIHFMFPNKRFKTTPYRGRSQTSD